MTTSGTVMFLLRRVRRSSPRTRSASSQEYLSIRQTDSSGTRTETWNVRTRFSHFLKNRRCPFLAALSLFRSYRWSWQQTNKCPMYKSLPMTGFETPTSGVGRSRSTNCAKTNAIQSFFRHGFFGLNVLLYFYIVYVYIQTYWYIAKLT